MNKNIQKNLTIILLLVIVIGLSVYIVKDYISNKDKIKLEKPIVDTFLYDFRYGYDYSSGTAQLLGYVEVSNRTDRSSGDNYKYVTFKILESNSEEFMKYLESNADNIYISKDSIGLGCLYVDTIKFINYSDQMGIDGMINTMSNDMFDIDKLLASTKDNPVRLNVAKSMKTMYYSYHPICESMLSDYGVPLK